MENIANEANVWCKHYQPNNMLGHTIPDSTSVMAHSWPGEISPEDCWCTAVAVSLGDHASVENSLSYNGHVYRSVCLSCIIVQ